MSDAASHRESVLRTDAINSKPGVDPDGIASQTSKLVTLLGWVFGGPPLLSQYSLAAILELPALTAVKGYLSYYNVHLAILTRLVASVKKAEPIDAAISEVEQNGRDYSTLATDFARRARADFPPTPWATVPAVSALVAILGASVLRRDSRFVREWNTYLAVYQVLTENAVEVAKYLDQQGRSLVGDSSARLADLRQAVDEISATVSLDVVIKHRYKERLDWMEVDLLPRVSEAASTVRDTAAYLERGPLTQARRAQRL